MPSKRTQQALARLADLTPRLIVAELDRYIVGQAEAKKAVAIALRNRWRRQRAPEAMREEISSNNIVLIGPTGSGKTEIARRLAKLATAPFIKVEASKFTEVGYVGRDVESMVRDLVESAIDMVRTERESEIEDLANERVDERILDLLVPVPGRSTAEAPAASAPSLGDGGVFVVAPDGAVTPHASAVAPDPVGDAGSAGNGEDDDRYRRTRDKLRQLLLDGQLEQREVELEVEQRGPSFDMMASPGVPEGADAFGEWLREMLPKRKKRRRMKVAEARRILMDEELEKLIDLEDVTADALERVESLGIIFLDEIDKIASARGDRAGGPDVSREGVQRDLLPIVEGSNVPTKYGLVRTDHILFIAAGAFHVAKPSDLIPELQGRFPIRVELKPLTEEDFVRIMTEPENALTKQYQALVEAEGARLRFTEGGIAEIARTAARVNERMENIGARRLHTVMTTLLEDVLYELPDRGRDEIVVDDALVRERLKAIAEDEDLRKYIL
ncbi:MAG: ATP-dependent protease ATPase subunit HslU [Gemmatirosa sp.]|nr:ATP-dependent protease ATPase subunit HslU [Gemmatirosa sp.]